MRDYIILNGVNSNTITGLLISTLPPITKPKQRTQIEEIDGRDGDIVTKLGYSAYDKELEIGLYGDFDIDDVIAYFNTEGTVTFSNEPYKFYNYQIIDQIDYEKLIRFKKAKIKMHVQPFKYPLEETPVEITIQTVNNEAEEMDLDNTAEAPMTIALKGNTSQDTTTGKNIFNINLNAGYMITFDSNGVGTTGSLSSWGVANIYPKSSPIFNVTANVEYYFSADVRVKSGTYNKALNYMRMKNVDAYATQTAILNPKLTSSFQKVCFKNVFSADGRLDFLYLQIADASNVVLEVKNIMVSTSSDTTYEPYTNGASPNPDYPQEISVVTGDNIITIENSDSSESQSYHITLPEGTELCKIGDYQDRIYKDSGKWYLKKEIGKKTYVGDSGEGWVYQSSYPRFFIEENTANSQTTRTQIVSNYFTYLSSGEADYGAFCYQSKFFLYEKDITSESDLKTWLSTHNTTVYYVLATPTTTEITDETLIAQLEALANASSYDTVTHITQNANDKPFILNATALQQGSGEATVNNEGNIYAKPTLDIEGTGTVGIYLDGNQIFSIDLSNSSECVIDTTKLEAYNPTTSELMNRQVTGDYSNFKLNAGDNQVEATGNITKVTISNYTRWL